MAHWSKLCKQMKNLCGKLLFGPHYIIIVHISLGCIKAHCFSYHVFHREFVSVLNAVYIKMCDQFFDRSSKLKNQNMYSSVSEPESVREIQDYIFISIVEVQLKCRLMSFCLPVFVTSMSAADCGHCGRSISLSLNLCLSYAVLF